MATENAIETRFLELLRQYFAPQQFSIRGSGQGGNKNGTTRVSAVVKPNDRKAQYVDTKRLLKAIDGQIIEREEDDMTVVIEGCFEGCDCQVTIIYTGAVATMS